MSDSTNLNGYKICAKLHEVGLGVVQELLDGFWLVDNDGVARALNLRKQRHVHVQRSSQEEESRDEPVHVDAGKHRVDSTLWGGYVML
jgi:hypothetical protein